MSSTTLRVLCALLAALGTALLGVAWLERWPLAMPITALGHFVVPLVSLALCWIPVVFAGRVLRARWCRGADPLPPLTSIATSWALGSIALVVVGMATLAAGIYSRVVWQLLASIGWVIVAAWLLLRGGGSWRQWWDVGLQAWSRLRSTPTLSSTGLLLLLLGLAMAAAVVPPNSRDELAYHLVLPTQWESSGAWGSPTDNPHLLFPANIELLWGYALAVGGLTAPRLLTLLFAVLTAGLLWEWLVESCPEPSLRGPSLLVLVVTPVAMTSAVSCLVEWPMLFFLVLGWRAARLSAGGQKPRLVTLAALSWGAALGCKYTAIPFVAALLLDWCLQLDWRSRIRAVVAVILAAMGLALPWWARNGLETGDPFFPLGGILRGDLGAGSQAARLVDYVEIPGLWRLMPWAFHATVDPVADHRLHLLWPLLLPLVLALGWRWRRVCPWWAVVGVTLVFAPFTPSPRVQIPLLVLLWFFLPPLLRPWARTASGPICVGIVTLVLVGLSLPFSLHHLFVAGSSSALKYLLGQQDRVAYLRSDGLLTPVLERGRSQIPESARVWTWCEDRTFYLGRWARADSPYGPPGFLRALRAGGVRRISEELRRDRIDFVLLNRRDCPETWRSVEREDGHWDLSDQESASLASWSARNLHEVARDPRFVLFAVVR